MDAVKFLEVKKRICNEHDCFDCPLRTSIGGCAAGTDSGEEKTFIETVEIVEKWSAGHPIETRQSEFLKIFPNATLDAMGSLDICPIAVDKNMNCQTETGAKCLACRKNYWLAEVARKTEEILNEEN